MGTPLASIGDTSIEIAAFGLVLFTARRVFGDQVLGLPFMLVCFALLAGSSIIENVGAIGILYASAGIVAMLLAIGLAMSLARRGDEQIDEREER